MKIVLDNLALRGYNAPYDKNSESQGILLLYERIVKSKLALMGMTMKDLAEEIHESYSSTHEVLHGRWGKNGEVARRIREKVAKYLDIPELSKEKNHENT